MTGKSTKSVVKPEIGLNPEESAKEAGLHYTSDVSPGIIRKKSGKSFYYVDSEGGKVADEKTLNRIRSLVIPPAWRDVWICPDPRGHLQATGKDVRGRKQYRYHPKWREVRDHTKYHQMISFGKALPVIRKKTEEHLALPGLPREKVLATIIQLLEKTLIRVGNEEYAKQNHSYGLTTMHDKHVDIHGKEVTFEFKGKSGVKHTVFLKDKRLSKIIKNCQDLPGYELFQYIDENGERRSIRSEDVNEYLKEITGKNFTAKDFRTWHGTVLAADALKELSEFHTQAEAKRNIVKAVEAVSKQLGNTKAICRKCYIHPVIINSYLEGDLPQLLQNISNKIETRITNELKDLQKDEAVVVVFLQGKEKLEAK